MNNDEYVDNWIPVVRALPHPTDIVWCLREWQPGHPIDAPIRQEVRLAMRKSTQPYTTDEDHATNSWWEEVAGDKCSWSDPTVKAWKPVIKPFTQFELDALYN